VAHLVGFDIPVILDVEMVAPGEGEIAAAKRLLERLLPPYSRFFDAVTGDALYFEGPFFNHCRKHGKHYVAVLKENNPALLEEAKTLLSGEPDLVREDDRPSVRYWDQEEFTTDAIKETFRILHTEETETKKERIAGKRVEKEQTTTWFWGTSIPQSVVPSRQLCQIGHHRWKIENRVFNALSANWGLDHCFHHHPQAILNFILILFIAYTLVECFFQLNLKDPLRKRLTLIALASEILTGIAAMSNRLAPWLRPMNNSPPT